MSDIVQITTHVVDYDPTQLDEITGTIAEFFSTECLPTNTLVGIASLSTEGLLIEIGGVAVTDTDLP
jgi:enamine deaminase RidA (YjgF/YER057c/UK114 family)